MRFQDMPVGTTFVFGTASFGGSVFWRKVSDQFAMSNSPIAYKNFNPAADRRTNFYPETYLHRWLNDESNGFLSLLKAEERDLLCPFEIKTAVPKGRKKELGTVCGTICRAALPAASNLVLDPMLHHNIPLEGESFHRAFSHGTVSRTACGDRSFYRIGRYGEPARISMTANIAVKPIIAITPEAQFFLDHDLYQLAPKVQLLEENALLSVLGDLL